MLFRSAVHLLCASRADVRNALSAIVLAVSFHHIFVSLCSALCACNDCSCHLDLLSAPVALSCVRCVCVCGLLGSVNTIAPSIDNVKHYFAFFKNYFFLSFWTGKTEKDFFFSLIWKKHKQNTCSDLRSARHFLA